MKKIVVSAGLIFALTIIGVIWWQNGLLAANSTNKTPKIFIIKPGEGVREIANNLKKQGLIRDPVVFFLLTKQKGLDKQIQAGDFRLNPSMKAFEIANNLTHGTLDIWVTIPEGQRTDEIADLLKEKMPNYEKNWREALNANEGYLFPDTYLLPRDADVNALISILKNNFQTKYESVKNLKTNGLSDQDTIILASMVEREAKTAKDRPLVASVILNRLNIGMKLDIDATIQFALGYQETQKRWWKKGLNIDDLKISSPYNTYQVAGLPPTPISNPGLESLKAALNPSETNYLFYMTDKKGINHYAQSIEEHNANIKKYGL